MKSSAVISTPAGAARKMEQYSGCAEACPLGKKSSWHLGGDCCRRPLDKDTNEEQ